MSSFNSRIYVGRLDEGRPTVYAVESAAVERMLPGGARIAWGAGVDEAKLELARALLTDAGGIEPPMDGCRLFSDQILSRLPADGFALQRDTVNAWLRRYAAVQR